jgi:folate-binding protein YgfZ
MKLPVSFGLHPYFPGTCLKISGEDAFPFLQGQFTQDLKPARAGKAVYGLWLDQKGKVLADSHVFQAPEATWIVLSYFSSGEVVRSRLESHIIADDVAVTDLASEWAACSIIGDVGASWIRERAKLAATETSVGACDGGYVFPGRRGHTSSWEWVGPRAQRPAFIDSAVGSVSLSAAEMERLRIDARIPAVPVDIGPKDLPNEGGLEADAISYTKGCYLGQEVMARLKSMGTVRRKLIRVRSERPLPALPQALLAGGKKVGELRSAVDRPAGGGFVGLALVSVLTFNPTEPMQTEEAGAAVVADLGD